MLGPESYFVALRSQKLRFLTKTGSKIEPWVGKKFKEMALAKNFVPTVFFDLP